MGLKTLLKQHLFIYFKIASPHVLRSLWVLAFSWIFSFPTTEATAVAKLIFALLDCCGVLSWKSNFAKWIKYCGDTLNSCKTHVPFPLDGGRAAREEKSARATCFVSEQNCVCEWTTVAATATPFLFFALSRRRSRISTFCSAFCGEHLFWKSSAWFIFLQPRKKRRRWQSDGDGLLLVDSIALGQCDKV